MYSHKMYVILSLIRAKATIYRYETREKFSKLPTRRKHTSQTTYSEKTAWYDLFYLQQNELLHGSKLNTDVLQDEIELKSE